MALFPNHLDAPSVTEFSLKNLTAVNGMTSSSTGRPSLFACFLRAARCPFLELVRPMKLLATLAILGTFEKQTPGPISRKCRKLFRPEKLFLKLRPACSVKLLFWYVVKGIKIKVSCLETTSFWRYKENYVTRSTPEKVSGLSRNGPQETLNFHLGAAPRSIF